MAIAVTGGGLYATPLTVHASGDGMGCNPNRAGDFLTYRFAGAINSNLAFQDVSSDILNYSPWVSTDSDGVFAWSMLDSNRSGSWAQIGWQEWPGGTRETFIQYTYDSSNDFYTVNLFPAQPRGSYTYYAVHTSSDNVHFTYSVNNTTVYTSTKSFTVNEAQIFAETHSHASQMPGQYGIPEDFNNSYVKLGGSILAFGGAATTSDPTSPATEYAVKYSGVDYQTSDSACAK